ncbi:CHRD domain-containing protein [Rivibacter subsaxonicus]|uniref:CHRD domain-containing protein n=1 Tax=Rivibacter subsaxonicus TaxID=457575 RepID=A0A4Q7VZY2_9BURK|nr:CHRD domain-containing protein [Rivibacter subsaxonicus]RZU02437.1 CHRD domain-containing protein [Rivibacter subsaxonicus]
MRTFPARSSLVRPLWATVLVVVAAACSDNDDYGGEPLAPSQPIVNTTSFNATLCGAQEVANVSSTGVAFAVLTVDTVTKAITGSVTTVGITGSVAHIHTGAAGVNGPITIPLAETAAGSGVWAVPANTMLSDAQYADLLAGAMYYNVHSVAFPAGEIRGQIGRDVRGSALKGAEEVPANASGATGRGFVAVDPVTRTLTASVTTSGVAGTVAHIHEGAAGVSGPIVFPLTETTPGSGVWGTVVTLSDAQYATLKAGNYYFNVHSAAIPAGEIRGQLGPIIGGGELSAANEVPPNASAATGRGIAVVDPVTLAISAGVKTSGLTGSMAHIHEAATGVNGPIIVNFGEAPAASGRWSAAAGAVLTPSQLSSFKAGNLYFNVHSAAYPGGEIRGQIATQ